MTSRALIVSLGFIEHYECKVCRDRPTSNAQARALCKQATRDATVAQQNDLLQHATPVKDESTKTPICVAAFRQHLKGEPSYLPSHETSFFTTHPDFGRPTRGIELIRAMCVQRAVEIESGTPFEKDDFELWPAAWAQIEAAAHFSDLDLDNLPTGETPLSVYTKWNSRKATQMKLNDIVDGQSSLVSPR